VADARLRATPRPQLPPTHNPVAAFPEISSLALAPRASDELAAAGTAKSALGARRTPNDKVTATERRDCQARDAVITKLRVPSLR
jgi:hypothetical protein